MQKLTVLSRTLYIVFFETGLSLAMFTCASFMVAVKTEQNLPPDVTCLNSLVVAN